MSRQLSFDKNQWPRWLKTLIKQLIPEGTMHSQTETITQTQNSKPQRSEVIRILQVEDDEVDRRTVERILNKSPLPTRFLVDSFERHNPALLHLREQDYDIALLDLGLPDSNGVDIIQKVRDVNSGIPIVVLTGFDDEETGLLAIKKGATDYLIKGTALDNSLTRAVLYAIERKKAQTELQLAEEKYRTIFENSAVAIMMADEHEQLVSWNRFTEKLLDMDEEDLYLKPAKSLYPAAEWENIRKHSIRKKGMQHHLETKMFKKNGEIIDVDLSMSTLKNTEGSVTGTIGVVNDITERKKAEKKIKETMEMKAEFISTVSHELRTPLTSMKEGISIVLDGLAGPLNKKQKNFLDIAKRNVERLSRLINDVLDFQKLDTGKMTFNMAQNDINEVACEVRNTMKAVAKNRKLKLSLKLENNLPKIKFDRDRIIQVLTNLVNNSIKFTEKGKITIETRQKENIILVSISDTGHGIKQDDLPKLFSKFEQLEKGGERKTGGTGLGLVISKDIIEQHNAKIWAESEENKGTTFYFVLPIVERRSKPR